MGGIKVGDLDGGGAIGRPDHLLTAPGVGGPAIDQGSLAIDTGAKRRLVGRFGGRQVADDLAGVPVQANAGHSPHTEAPNAGQTLVVGQLLCRGASVGSNAPGHGLGRGPPQQGVVGDIVLDGTQRAAPTRQVGADAGRHRKRGVGGI